MHCSRLLLSCAYVFMKEVGICFNFAAIMGHFLKCWFQDRHCKIFTPTKYIGCRRKDHFDFQTTLLFVARDYHVGLDLITVIASFSAVL